MIAHPGELRSRPKMRALLGAYAELSAANPEAEWHDRVMALESCDAAELEKLHGLLLAYGWVETRVHAESLRTPGRLEACYRITPDGKAALRLSAGAEPAEVIDEDEDFDGIS